MTQDYKKKTSQNHIKSPNLIIPANKISDFSKQKELSEAMNPEKLRDQSPPKRDLITEKLGKPAPSNRRLFDYFKITFNDAGIFKTFYGYTPRFTNIPKNAVRISAEEFFRDSVFGQKMYSKLKGHYRNYKRMLAVKERQLLNKSEGFKQLIESKIK